jgi:hypothetical protein
MGDEFSVCPPLPGQSEVAAHPNDACRVAPNEDRGINIRLGPRSEVKPCRLPQVGCVAGAGRVADGSGPDLEELVQVCCERNSAENRARVKRLFCGR